MVDFLYSTKTTIVIVGLVGFLPFLCAMLAKISGGFRRTDNGNPREFLAQMTGKAARLNAAQMNSFEGLPLFFVAVVLGLYSFVPVSAINAIALLYLVLRVIFIIAYAKNLSLLRSVVWLSGLVSCLFLLYLSWVVSV